MGSCTIFLPLKMSRGLPHLTFGKSVLVTGLPLSIEGFSLGRLVCMQVIGCLLWNGGYRKWSTPQPCYCHYRWLADLTSGTSATSLWVHPISRLNVKRRAQSMCFNIQAFLRGCLCLNEKGDSKPPSQVASRSTSPSKSRGLSTNFPDGSFDLLTPNLHLELPLLAAPPRVLFITPTSFEGGPPCPCPASPLP